MHSGARGCTAAGDKAGLGFEQGHAETGMSRARRERRGSRFRRLRVPKAKRLRHWVALLLQTRSRRPNTKL